MVDYILQNLAYLGLFMVFLPLFFVQYERVLVPGIKLKDAFFEKDNVPAGLEFAGMFLAVSYIVIHMIAGPDLYPFVTDIWHVAVEILLALLLFGLGRTLFGWFIATVNPYKDQEAVRLNTEIYEQRNYAATLVSLAWIVALANAMAFIDLFGGQLAQSLIIAGSVIFLNIVAMVWGYKLLMLHGGPAYKELFIDNNPAVGVSFFGFVFAFNIVLDIAARDLPDVITWDALGSFGLHLVVALAVSGLAMLCVSGLFMRMLMKKSLYREITEDNNVGAAFMQATVLIGIMVVSASIAF